LEITGSIKQKTGQTNRHPPQSINYWLSTNVMHLVVKNKARIKRKGLPKVLANTYLNRKGE
jgi:uncharacterized protein YbcV (DUF1398 family)